MEPSPVTSEGDQPQPKRRFIRRFLLIVVGVCALLISVAACWISQHPRRQAINTLRQYDQIVVPSAPSNWMGISNLIGFERSERWFQFLTPIDRVSISTFVRPDGSGVGDEDHLVEILRCLDHFPELKELDINWRNPRGLGKWPDSEPSDELRSASQSLRHLTNLERVHISDVPLDDECLVGLASSPKLIHLSVWDAPVTGSMFEQPWKSTGILWSIELPGTRFDHKHIPALRQFRDLHTLMCSDFPYCDCKYCESERKHQPKLWEGYEEDADDEFEE